MKLYEWLDNRPSKCNKQVIIQIDKQMYPIDKINPYVYDIIEINNYQTHIIIKVKRDFNCAFDE